MQAYMASSLFTFMAAALTGFALFAISTLADDPPNAFNAADRVLRDLSWPGHGDASAVGDGTSGGWAFAHRAAVMESRPGDREIGTALPDDSGEDGDTNMLVYSGYDHELSTHPDQPQLEGAYASADRYRTSSPHHNTVPADQHAQWLDQTETAAGELATPAGDHLHGADSSGGPFRSLLHACHSRGYGLDPHHAAGWLNADANTYVRNRHDCFILTLS